jgi:predicted NAD-dependent protein-ADP-ribosyltransferase YbiA (DUF1768 family)
VHCDAIAKEMIEKQLLERKKEEETEKVWKIKREQVQHLKLAIILKYKTSHTIKHVLLLLTS